MSGNETPQSVIKKFEKRQKMMPYVLGALAGMLVLVGIFIVIKVASGSNGFMGGLFSTKTPTPTMTFTPTATQPSPTPSNTPTITSTPLPSVTATTSGPWQYTVLEDDNCYSIANTYDADIEVLLAINGWSDGSCPINPGDKIWVPSPDQEMPTATPFPTDFPHGTIITYTVRSGDNLYSIAALCFTTVEDIMARNKITDQNSIEVGDELTIKYYNATPVPTVQATSTLSVTLTPPSLTGPTATPSPSPTK